MRRNLLGLIFCFLLLYFDEANPNENNVRNVRQRSHRIKARDSVNSESLAEWKEFRVRKTKG